MVDRLSQLGYTVVSLSYRVYPDADIHGQVRAMQLPYSLNVILLTTSRRTLR